MVPLPGRGMVKVECESCNAPFQIDERRIPPAGLKMRCPKCGHSFLVPSPAAAELKAAPTPAESTTTGLTAAPRVPGASLARPGPPGAVARPSANNLKSTMVGVGGGFGLPPLAGGPSAAAPAKPAAVAPVVAPAKAVPVAAVKPISPPSPKGTAGFGRKTMVGIAPEAVPRGVAAPPVA
ncbi:MAG TPA: zinc-ribbon domain-containing protein, partial [Polyangiaceae bacterium]